MTNDNKGIVLQFLTLKITLDGLEFQLMAFKRYIMTDPKFKFILQCHHVVTSDVVQLQASLGNTNSLSWCRHFECFICTLVNSHIQ
jgi:hypothetical protein